MKQIRNNNTKDVYILSQKVNMKFMPSDFNAICEKQAENSTENGLAGRFKKIINFKASKTITTMDSSSTHQHLSTNSHFSSSGQLDSIKQYYSSAPLTFIQKLSNQHYIIGNQFQLDIVGISGVSQAGFVETEYFFSLHYGKRIKILAIDTEKHNLAAVCVDNAIKIYKYNSKHITHEKWKCFKQLNLRQEPKSISLVKNGHLCVFFQKRVDIYLVGESVMKKKELSYVLPQIDNYTFKLLTVPKPYQNILNIFFQGQGQKKNIFTLWSLQLTFKSSDIISGQAKKIYDIKSSLKNSVVIKNYGKDIYLMNDSREVTAMKKGYIIDSASVDIDVEGGALKYVNNNVLMHITNNKIQIYHYKIDQSIRPEKVKASPIDAIKMQPFRNYNFFAVLPMYNDNYLFFHQIDPKCNKICNGEVSYSLLLTRPISKNDKFDLLFGKKRAKFDPGDPQLIERCDIASKMGINKKQIYLGLWHRSTQCDKEDYQILISTDDFSAIKSAIQNKLKKSSMSYKQIENTYKQCFCLLQKKVFSSKCTENNAIDYIFCHFFLRKLQMWKQTKLFEKKLNPETQIIWNEKQKNNMKEKKSVKMPMTIQQYQYLSAMNIRDQLVSLVGVFCFEANADRQKAIRDIRFLLKTFKFVFRTCYYEILESIVIKALDKLPQFLQALPQLLPYEPSQANSDPNAPPKFYEGVWPLIDEIQWHQSLYVDAITTIDNKETIIEDVLKNITFRRNWLTKQDLVTLSKNQINDHLNKIKSNQTFFLFISKVFRYNEDRSIGKKIIELLEKKYETFPIQMHNKIFLYAEVFLFLRDKQILPPKNQKFYQFLQLKDYEVIAHCFSQERSFKGMLLCHIKPIFEEICGEDQGAQLFNKALLNYFCSDLSQISDLKYILNRVNNKKIQFHRKNQKMYEVLAESLQRKMIIGTGKDIPISEVVIYFQNIPWNSDQQQVPKGLRYLKQIIKIKDQVKILQQAKVNMSIYNILKNQDEVLQKLIKYFIQYENISRNIQDLSNSDVGSYFNKISKQVIEKTEKISQEIYLTPNSKLIFFTYITKISEQENMIQFIISLLKNKDLDERFFDENTAKSFVQYMYRWKMSENHTMITNEQYVSNLLNTLQLDSPTRIFIESQMSLAKLLSYPNHNFQYPLYEQKLTINDVRRTIQSLPVQILLKTRIQQIYQPIHKIQKIFLQYNSPENQDDNGCLQFVTMHQILELYILKLIYDKKMREALPYIHQILALQINDSTTNIVYPMIYIEEICHELNEESKKLLTECIFYYFNDPIRLTEIVSELVTKPSNSKQINKYLHQCLKQGQSKSHGFSVGNFLFAKQYNLENLQKNLLPNFMLTIFQSLRQLRSSKQEFKQPPFSCIMSILCNSPFVLAKYISCARINITAVRCFLSYAIHQQIFDPLKLLQMSRRMFIILLLSEKRKIPIQIMIEQYNQYSLDDQIQVQYSPDVGVPHNSYENIMWKSSLAFKKKKAAIQAMKKNLPELENFIDKSHRLKKNLSQGPIVDEQPIQYPFHHLDSDNNIEETIAIRIYQEDHKTENFEKFNEIAERRKVLNNSQNSSLFSSSRNSQRNSSNIEISFNQATSQKFYPLPQMKNQMSLGQDLKHSSQGLFMKDSTPKKSQINNNVVQIANTNIQIIQAEQGLIKQISQQVNIQESNRQIKNIIPESTEQKLAKQIIQQNTEILEKNQPIKFNLTSLKAYLVQSKQIDQNKRLETIKSACTSIYTSQNIKFIDRKLQLIQSIFRYLKQCQQFQKQAISSLQQSIDLIIKAEQLQVKILRDIKFEKLLNPQDLFSDYSQNKKQLFYAIYPNLQKLIDQYNVSNAGLFISRLFSDTQLRGQLIWDFIMSLSNKISSQNQQQVVMNLQKIEVTLPKVGLHIWLRKLNSFSLNVLQSKYKNRLLPIFCNYLKISTPKKQAIQFLQQILSIQKNSQIQTTLSCLKNS